jgi:hypothetical protein
MNRTLIFLLFLSAVFFGPAPRAFCQTGTYIYEEIDLDPTPPSSVNAYCTAILENPTDGDYPGLGEDCSGSGPTGTMTSDECDGGLAGQFTVECDFTLPLVPGNTYSAEGATLLYFSQDPDDDDYLDPLDFEDGYSGCSTANAASGQDFCELLPGTDGYNYTNYPAITIFSPLSLSVVSISISPTAAALFETEALSLSANTTTADWCLQQNIGECNPDTRQPNGLTTGTLVPNFFESNSYEASSATFTAGDTPNPLDPSSNTYAEVVCDQDGETSENWACSSLALNELTVSISPGPNVQALPGVLQFVVSIPQTSLTTSWDVTASIGSPPVQAVTCTVCFQETWNYTAPNQPGVTSAITATATVTLPNSQKLTAFSTASVLLESPPVITFPSPVQNIPGVLGTILNIGYSANPNPVNVVPQWTLAGATGYVSCGSLTSVTLSCTITTQPTSVKVIQATVCLKTPGGAQSYCSATPATIELSPPCTTAFISGPKLIFAEGGLLREKPTDFGLHSLGY